MKLVKDAEKELSGKGRVLLRYSGTEPKIRLLIEGRELDMIDKQADRIADAIQREIGAYMNTVTPSEVEESRCVTLKAPPRGPSIPLRFARDDN